MSESAPPEAPTVCRYPRCARPRKPATAPGQRPMYCEDPDHNPTSALRARRRLEREQSGAAVGEGNPALDRPVTMGRASAGQLSEQLQATLGEFARLAEQAMISLRTVGDVEAVETEIEAVHHDARRQVDEARAAAFAAQRAAQQARDAAADQAQQRAEADAAAEEAIARAEVAEEAAESARAEQAEADKQAAADIARAGQEAAEQIAQAQADAQQQVTAAHAEVANARAVAEEQISRVMGESEARVADAQHTARAAETARAAAEQRAADEHAVAERLREELASSRAEHRAELERLRTDFRNDRDQMRADTAARLEDLQAAWAAAEQRAADEHAVAERLREELASSRAEHRAELERLRTDTAARIEELHAAHRAQLEGLTSAATRTRSEPDPAAGERPTRAGRGRRRGEQSSDSRQSSTDD